MPSCRHEAENVLFGDAPVLAAAAHARDVHVVLPGDAANRRRGEGSQRGVALRACPARPSGRGCGC